MAKPEKRWQLLLVADDGRIIPFKRIKGLVVTLAILLVALGLICAGLGWQLTAEKVRHRRTNDQLADANHQLDRYKSENELITAELVLAELRMEKAGLPVTKRHERVPQQPPAKTVASKSIDDAAMDDGGNKTTPAPAQGASVNQPSSPLPVSPGTKAGQESASAGPSPDATAKTEPPPVTLGNLKVTHDTEKRILLARFQVKNNQPRQAKVAGRCVVVLKNDLAPNSWLAMPNVTLVDGVPEGKQGRVFKISKFINMEMMATVKSDPSAYKTASVYVFDTSGAKVLVKNFPVDLPAPKPEPVAASAAKPVAEETTSSAQEGPSVELGDLKMTHDAGTQLLLARFRLKNTGPRSSPIAGRCVVVLKSEGMDTKDWLAMPTVSLENGKPNGTRGQAFKIARFRDMEIKARGLKDPSAFKTATIYIFDTAGSQMLEQDVPIDLPAPEPQAEPVVKPIASPAAQDTQAPPTESPPDAPPTNQQLPAQGVPDAAGSPGSEQPSDAGTATTAPLDPTDAPDDAPADDPSLTEGVEPKETEDARSRF